MNWSKSDFILVAQPNSYFEQVFLKHPSSKTTEQATTKLKNWFGGVEIVTNCSYSHFDPLLHDNESILEIQSDYLKNLISKLSSVSSGKQLAMAK